MALFYSLPLFVVMGLRSVAWLPGGGWMWGLFAVAYLSGAWGGYSVQKRWILGYSMSKVHLAGDSLTLIVMMTLFIANFDGGTLWALALEIYVLVTFHGAFAACVAMSSGSFAGRALRLMWGGRDVRNFR